MFVFSSLLATTALTSSQVADIAPDPAACMVVRDCPPDITVWLFMDEVGSRL
jgi:hypothetical protein